MTAATEPWATLEIRLHDPGDGGWGEAGERLEALAALLAEDDRALGVETRDMSTLGHQALHPELIVYTRPDALAELAAAASRLAQELRLELELTPTVRTDDDWHDTWKQFYAPIIFGDGALLLRPSWLERRPGDPARELVLDPGRAFGTGQHETTRLCLDLLVELAAAATPVRRVLDLGCGSGILALAAARLFPAAGPIVAADNDPDAAATAAENAAINGLEHRVDCVTATVRELDTVHDLVLANIRPSVLIPIAADLAARVARGGTLILSGILGEEADAVSAAYLAVGLHPRPRRDLNEWCALVFTADGAAA